MIHDKTVVKIGAIIDIKTRETKTPHRIGRECTVTFVVGSPAIIQYPDGRWWHTSNVVEFEENDLWFWIVTLNTSYRFDYI